MNDFTSNPQAAVAKLAVPSELDASAILYGQRAVLLIC